PACYFLFFFFECSGAHRALHSFPTRRSSDLVRRAPGAGSPVRHESEAGRARHAPAAQGLRRSGGPAGPRAPAQNRLLSRWARARSEEHTSELQSRENLVCRLLLEKKKTKINY